MTGTSHTSESTRDGGGHHVTVCIWYMPRSAD